MKHRVRGKQPNSKMCLVCGLKNAAGVKASFYELETGELVALFTPGAQHQGYPGRLHGGIATALLDETIGRAIRASSGEEIWGVTLEFTTRFRRPIPLEAELRVVGRITQDGTRVFEGTGEILLPDGQVAATGSGKYMRLPIEKITDFNPGEQEWMITPLPSDPSEITV